MVFQVTELSRLGTSLISMFPDGYFADTGGTIVVPPDELKDKSVA